LTGGNGLSAKINWSARKNPSPEAVDHVVSLDADGLGGAIPDTNPTMASGFDTKGRGRSLGRFRTRAVCGLCSAEECPYLRDIEKLTRCALHPLPAPAGFARNSRGVQPIEAPRHRKGAHQAAANRRPEPAHCLRQTSAGADRGEEVVSDGLLPMFLRRPPASGTRPARRCLGRRDAPAARYSGAR